MKVKKMNWLVRTLTGGWAAAITLAPFGIYVHPRYWDWATKYPDYFNSMIEEEKIHWKQQTGLLILFFYIIYFFDWFVKLFKYGKLAYYNISFEREAKLNKYTPSYKNERKWWYFMKYMFTGIAFYN